MDAVEVEDAGQRDVVDHAGGGASRPVVAPTIRLDWTEKNAKASNPRSTPVGKRPGVCNAV
jgi:hypothetical protein